MAKQGKVSSPDKDLDKDVGELLDLAEQREGYGQEILRPRLSQAETKREIVKQKAKNAVLQRNRGVAPTRKEQGMANPNGMLGQQQRGKR